MNQRSQLLNQIQAHDFAIYETALYLDGHPNCKRALAFYNKEKELVSALKREYEQKFGPLTIYSNNSNDTWYWVDSPWPWEMEGN